MTRPRLKSLDCIAVDDRLIVSFDPSERVEIDDPDGQVAALLSILQQGTRTPEEVHRDLRTAYPSLNQAGVDGAIASLDELGWLEDASAAPVLSAEERARYASNLAFFAAFSSLDLDCEQLQLALVNAHIVVLGAGGLGSSVIQNLAGLGIGRVTLVDYDSVELKNLARQFTYSEAQIGRPKVECLQEWVGRFNSNMTVSVVNQELTSPAMIEPLLAGVDLLINAIDHPPQIDLWVNKACVPAGIPYIRGGLSFTQASYWSVDPGRSACRECLETYRSMMPDAGLRDRPRMLRQEPVNRGIAPVAGLLGALISMEAVRYVTAIAPPVSAGAYQLVQLGRAAHADVDAWPSDPACPVCRQAPDVRRCPGGDARVATPRQSHKASGCVNSPK